MESAPGRRMTFAVTLIAAAVLVVVNVWLHSGPGSYRLATAPTKSGLSLLAASYGVLHGEANAYGTACFWQGDASEAKALYRPYRFSAGGFRLSVFDASGNRVVTVGQMVVSARSNGIVPPTSRGSN